MNEDIDKIRKEMMEELDKAFQEAIDREIISIVKETNNKLRGSSENG